MRLAHRTPFHSQTSLPARPPEVFPPNITTTCRALSYTMAQSPLADGESAGCRSVHVTPFHSHVSEKAEPPKRTVTPRELSYAIAWPSRGAGDTGGVR